MEFLSPEFRRAVHSAILESSKPSICVVHKRYTIRLIEELGSSPEATEEELTFENRDLVQVELQKDIIRVLSTLGKEKS